MTRGNRFTARGVEDVARRRAQATEGTPYHATEAEHRWGAVGARPAPEIRTNVDTTGWNWNTTAAVDTPRFFTDQMLQHVTIPDHIFQQTIRVEPAAPMRGVREINLNDLRITPTLPRDPIQERREQVRREFREREMTEEGRLENELIRVRNRNWRTGDRSRKKAEGLAKVLYAAMAMNRNYNGRVFSYKIVESTGTWFVDSMAVAEVDTQTCKLKKLMLPPFVKEQVAYRNIPNKVRFLWRQLGLKAVRYKDTTIVHTGLTGSVLSPGEDWVINPAYVKSFTEHPPKEMTQERLFNDYDTSNSDTTKPRTKPVQWADYNGRPMYDHRYLEGGTRFDLNNPPADAGGSSEQDNADS